MIHALREGMGCETISLWHKDRDLQGVDMVVLPGGFSYGDYLRSGAIARFSPIMEEVIKHANRGGYVLGVCNGFQILTEAGLVPGALLRNRTGKFVSKNVHLVRASGLSTMTAGLSETGVYQIPIAHGEGRYHADEETLKASTTRVKSCFATRRPTERLRPKPIPTGRCKTLLECATRAAT